MAPVCYAFPAAHLPQHVQIDLKGKKRKTEGGKDVELDACALLSMFQYNCTILPPVQRGSRVKCDQVLREFRR